MISTISPRNKTPWREVRGPCPICRHHHWCRVSPGGALVACRRQENGAIKRLDYSDGPAYLHAVAGNRTYTAPPLPTAQAGAPRAPDACLARLYHALLADHELCLRHNHRKHLHQRGLTAADLQRAGYRSLPGSCRAGVLRRLRERLPDGLLLGVPGVIAKDGPRGRYLTLAGSAGLLIPVRNAAGHLVGLVVRPDDPDDGGKYRWLSSARHGGPSPGARVHVPAGVRAARSVKVVEGTLKSDVVFALSGEAVIGLPGPFVTPEALAALHALGARQALLALDADARTNPTVARAQAEGLAKLNAAGFEGGLIRWERSLGKGLDDALLARRRKEAV
jgi:hypothetical protein